MDTTTFRTHWARSSHTAKGLLVATLAVGAWALSSAASVAHASDVYWSVGVNQPGVSVGVSNARPVYVQPAPVYVQPAPVYVQPQPVYVQPRPVVIHQPGYQYVRPVVVAPQPVYYHPGWRGQGHGHGHGHWKDRDDRRDDHRGGHGRHGGRDWDDGDRHGRR